MHSAFNLFVFPNSMFTPLLLFCFVFLKYFLWKGYELSGEIALKNNHYYYYYLLVQMGSLSDFELLICVFLVLKCRCVSAGKATRPCLPILMLLYIMLYIVLAYLMLFAALTNSVCLNNASFFFLFKYFLCQGYELSGEIALKNNHYYYYY